MTDIVFTDDEVASLNAYQLAGVFHPYTCGKCRDDLLATPHGWVCPECGYLQTTAMQEMKDWTWLIFASPGFHLLTPEHEEKRRALLERAQTGATNPPQEGT